MDYGLQDSSEHACDESRALPPRYAAKPAMDDACAVYAEPLEWVAYGACGHRGVCSACVARLCFVLRDHRCCLCMTHCPGRTPEPHRQAASFLHAIVAGPSLFSRNSSQEHPEHLHESRISSSFLQRPCPRGISSTPAPSGNFFKDRADEPKLYCILPTVGSHPSSYDVRINTTYTELFAIVRSAKLNKFKR